MSFSPYFVCVLLGVDSLRGGLAEGNRIWKILLSLTNMAGMAGPAAAKVRVWFGVMV